MIVRALALAAGMTGAAGLSQFPEFSQQYMQRLGGAVDELARQVRRYESDAAEAGLSLPGYIDALAAEGRLAKRQAANMSEDVDRHARLSASLAQLEGAGPFTRARLAAHFSDRDVAERAWDAFRPAVPATFEGAVFAGTGFVAGWLGLALVLGFLRQLWATGRKLRPASRTRQAAHRG